MSLDEALRVVREAGYVAIKEKSYRQAQERQRVAEALRRAAEDDAENARAWARDCKREERRICERLTFLYGAARAHGATEDELARGLFDTDEAHAAEVERVDALIAEHRRIAIRRGS